ncbi:type II secretion system secretin GspD [Ottowia sp.]|uniref:type II secretion system secretin GspD n=1 Tax=Ottowia sp. TaxID=1898956 RepID=UPI003A88107C
MSQPRTYPSLLAPALASALAALLAGCAQPGIAPADQPVDMAAEAATPAVPAAASPSAPPVAPVLPASAPLAAASSDQDATNIEPMVIRGTDRVVAAQRPSGNAPARGAVSRLQFEGAPVGEVVKVMLNDLLKVDYVVHPPLNGAVTLTTRQTVNADRALLLLEAALQANGIVMARDSRGTYHVGTPETLRGIVSAPVLAEAGKPLPPGYGAVIIPLQYLGAGEMANILQPLVSGDAILRVDTMRNILVMRGTRAEAEGWLDLVSTFDVNLLRGMSVGVFPLKHTTAADVEAALQMMSGGAASAGAASAVAGAGGRGQPGVASSGTARSAAGNASTAVGSGAQAGAAGAAGLGASSPLFGALRVMPIERINAVMVVTPRAAYLDEVRYWIEQFDRPNLKSGEPQLFVYKIQNSSASHLAELINGIYGGTTSAQPAATGVAPGLSASTGSTGSGIGANRSSLGSTSSSSTGLSSLGSSMGSSSINNRLGNNTLAQRNAQQAGGNVTSVSLDQNVRVMADKINNTLLVYATPGEYQRIEATLKRLDIQRAQVLIEASIVEVTLSDGLEYGLEWSFNNSVGSSHTGSGVIGSAAAGALAATGAGSGGFTYTLSSATGIRAVLRALAQKSLVKVISSPSLMVMDNHTAAIQVGNQEPVNIGTTTVSGSTTGITSSTSIQYKDTGVMLDVTPSISAGDLITLDVNQMVTDLGPDSTSGKTDGYPTFMQRQITSKVAVRSGETMVLGGLIKDNSSRGKSGVPLLSQLPGIGALFGSTEQASARTELLVVLTPRVVRSDEDARAVSRELRERMRGLTASGLRTPPISTNQE